MAKKFEAGKHYWPYDESYGSARVLSRTESTITVLGECGVSWEMEIQTDAEGNEFAVDMESAEEWGTEGATYEARRVKEC